MTHYFKCYGCKNVTGLRPKSQICNPRIWESETERFSLSLRSNLIDLQKLATNWDPSFSINQRTYIKRECLVLWVGVGIHHVQEHSFRKMHISISMAYNHSNIIQIIKNKCWL